MTSSKRKRCVVAFARSDRQFLWHVDLAEDATIADAIAAARMQTGNTAIPWDSAEVGVYGERKSREAVPQDGDRIEIYRPLALDPRERRRQRMR